MMGSKVTAICMTKNVQCAVCSLQCAVCHKQIGVLGVMTSDKSTVARQSADVWCEVER